jgi:hypothetical protein
MKLTKLLTKFLRLEKKTSKEASEPEIVPEIAAAVAKPSTLEPAANTMHTPPVVTTQSRVVVRAGFVNGQPGVIEVDEATGKRLASRAAQTRLSVSNQDLLNRWRRK